MILARLSPSLREAGYAFAILLALATAIFFPFIIGDRTLEDGAATVNSLYPSGARYPNPAPVAIPRESDPYAGSLFTEPILALDHNEIFRDNTIPLWNPYSGYGIPLAADMQSQPFSPFAALPIVRPSSRAYDAFLAIRLLAGAFLTILYLRRFARFLPAVTGGIAFFLGGYFWLFISLPQESVEVLTPGLLLGVELVLARPQPRTAAILGILCGLSLLGGMPEASALSLIFATTYAVARLIALRRAFAKTISYLACAGALGLALSAIVVVPFLSYANLSSNSHRPGDAASVIDSTAVEPLSADILAQYIAPLVAGTPHYNQQSTGPAITNFFGAATFFFASLAFLGAIGDFVRRRPRERAPVFFFATVACVAIARRFGFGPARILDHLPVLRLIVLNKYEEAIVACCVCALAAFGIERLCEKRVRAEEALIAFLGQALLLAAVAATPSPAVPAHEELRTLAVDGAFFFLAVAAMIVATSMRSKTVRPHILAIAPFVAIVLELPLLFVVPLYDILNPQAPSTLSPLRGAPYISFLQTRLTNSERFFGEDALLTPEWSAAYSIADVRALDALYPARYLAFVRALLPAPDKYELLDYFVGRSRYDLRRPLVKRFFELSGVRYVGFAAVRGAPAPSAIDGLRPVFADGAAMLYEFPAPLPRVALYYHAVSVRDGTAALTAIAKPNFDPSRSAIVEGSIPSALRTSAAVPVTAARFERYAATDVVVAATASAPGLLMLSDTNFDGWIAMVDGAPAPIIATDYLFRGVVIGPGKHRVEFRYAPGSYAIGTYVSLTAVSLLSIALIFGGNRAAYARRRNTAQS